MKRSIALLLVLSAGFEMCIGRAAAQVASPPAAPGTPAPTPAAPAPATAIPASVREEKRVFVPFEDLEKTLKDQGQGVFLPYREFLEMWNQLTMQREKEREKPPTDGLLASADYKGTVEGEVAVIDAVLKVESFKDGWAVLPLGGPGMSIAKAETGEATLRLGEKGPEIILPKKGRYELKLQIFAKVQRSAGRFAVSLRPPRTAVSKLELSIPEQGWDFSSKPAAAFTAQAAPDGRTQFAIFFGETEEMEIAWQKAGEESKLTPLLFADTQAHCELAPGALHTRLDIRYSILRAGVASFELAVPAPHEVLTVRGLNLKEWNVAKGPEGLQTLTVTLHAPAKNEFTLSLDLEAPVENLPATLSAPAVETKGVVRQRGSVEVHSAGELDVEIKDAKGLAQQAVAMAVPAQAATENAAAPAPAPAKTLLGNWRYLKLPFALSFAAKKAEPVVDVESFTNLRILPDLATLEAKFDYTIKRAGLFGTALLVPPDWTNVDVTGEPVESFTDETTGEGATRRRLVNVKFKNKLEGGASFVLSARLARATAETDATVPVFVPQGVARHDALVGVQVDDTLETLTRQAGGLQQEDVVSLLKHTAALQTKGAEVNPYTIGFRYRGEVVPAVLGFRAKKPQVNGEVLTLAEIREQSVVYHWWIAYDILYSGVDSFVLSVPKALAADVRIETKTLKETDKAFQPATGVDATREYWKITARDKVRGKFVIELSLEKPWGGLEPGKTIDTLVPEISLHDVFQETGQIAVVKNGNLEVLAPEAAASLEPVDPKDLAPQLQRPGIFLAYKWKRHPVSLKLPVTRNELIEVPQAIVTYADLTTVVSTDRAITTEVVYWLQNNTQQYLTVRLPKGGKMLSEVTVAGTAQQPQRRSGTGANAADLLVRLPAAQDDRRAFPVRFVYDVPASSVESLGRRGSMAVPAPELLDAAILQTQVTLYLPSGFAYHNFDSPLHLPVQTRGWTRLRRAFGWLIPALGPQIPDQAERPWPQPPQIETEQRGGFDFQIPRDGVPFKLHRLEKPAEITLRYRSKRLEHTYEALGLLAALLVGLRLSWACLRARLAFVLIGGFGALVWEGVAQSGLSGFLRWFYLGVLLSVGWWFLLGTWRLVRRGKKKLPPSLPPRTPPPAPTDEPPPPSTPTFPSVTPTA